MNSPFLGAQVTFEKGSGGKYDWGYGCFVGPCRSDKVWKNVLEWKSSALLWIDETTGDYTVAWIFRQHYLFSYKRGDDSWTNLKPRGGANALGFRDVACENRKLYVLTTDQAIKIFDSSQEDIVNNPYRNHPFRFEEKPWEFVWKRKIAIDKSGEVLIILSLKEVKYEEKLLFYVFKMNLESCKLERVESIGNNEMLVFGHGVTVNAPVKDCGDGIKSGIICFVDDDVWPDHQDLDDRASDCGVFDLATSRIEWPKKLRFYINETQWFVPGIAH